MLQRQTQQEVAKHERRNREREMPHILILMTIGDGR
jgi:hypothetical protein